MLYNMLYKSYLGRMMMIGMVVDELRTNVLLFVHGYITMVYVSMYLLLGQTSHLLNLAVATSLTCGTSTPCRVRVTINVTCNIR